MKSDVLGAVSNHPVSTGITTMIMGVPVIDLLDLASSVTTLIAGCMGIAVAWFLIQAHRSNIKVNECKIKQMQSND